MNQQASRFNGFWSRFNGFWSLFRWHAGRERGRFCMFLLFSALFTALVVFISDSMMPTDVQQMISQMPDFVQKMAGDFTREMLTEELWIALLFEHPIIVTLLLAFPISGALKGMHTSIQDGTLEPVLAQPLSRSTYFFSLAALLGLGGILLAFGNTAAAYLSAEAFYPGNVRFSYVFQLGISAAALAIATSGLSLLCSAAPIRSTLWLIGLLVLCMMLKFLATMWEPVSWIDRFSLFGYYEPRGIMLNGFALSQLIGLIAIGIGLHIAAWWTFNRRALTF